MYNSDRTQDIGLKNIFFLPPQSVDVLSRFIYTSVIQTIQIWYKPGAYTVKLITAVIYGISYKLDRLFQPGLMFVRRARGHLKDSSLGQVPALPLKHLTKLERLARDKHFCLLQNSVNYSRNKFYSTGPRGCFLFELQSILKNFNLAVQ